jgi:hypothetical protein
MTQEDWLYCLEERMAIMIESGMTEQRAKAASWRDTVNRHGVMPR